MTIRRMAARIVAVGCVLLSSSAAAAAPIVFDGDTYYRDHVSQTKYMRVMEYRRKGDRGERWTRRVAVRQFPRLRVSPRRALISFSRQLRIRYPGAHDQILQTDQGREAQIDFILVAPDRSYMQFGVRHYVRRSGYRGLISYEFSYRLTDLSGTAMKTFSAQRRKWIAAMLQADWPIPFAREEQGKAGSRDPG